MFQVFINSITDREPNDTTSKWSTYFSTELELPKKSKFCVKDVQLCNTASQFTEQHSILWVATNSGTHSEIATAIHIDYSLFYSSMNDVVDNLNTQVQTLQLPLEFSLVDTKVALKNTHSSTSFRILSDDEFETSFSGQTVSSGIDYNGKTFNKMNLKLGFSGDLRGTSISPGTTQVANSLPLLIRSTCYYLTTSLNDYENVFSNPYKNPNICCKIPTTNNFGSVICATYTDPIWYDLTDFTIDKVSFSILDDRGNEVDLNGGYVCLSLVFKTD